MGSERKIYTKTGDLGETSLLGGTRVLKSHEQVEAYGTIDELNCYIGLIRDQEIGEHYQQVLLNIQENLFIAEAWVATDPEHNHDNLPVLNELAILQLEKEIDEMNQFLPELVHFILPGGSTPVSYCHIARTVCRRAERTVIRLSKTGQNHEIVVKYLNRLSDYLFVLARKVAKDGGTRETSWIPLH
jgi:cob(I)alamin adenosyltransferase